MSILTTRGRKAKPQSQFALPGKRYPVYDRAHAADAKARASEMYAKGRLSATQKATIDRAADRVLSRKP